MPSRCDLKVCETFEEDRESVPPCVLHCNLIPHSLTHSPFCNTDINCKGLAWLSRAGISLVLENVWPTFHTIISLSIYLSIYCSKLASQRELGNTSKTFKDLKGNVILNCFCKITFCFDCTRAPILLPQLDIDQYLQYRDRVLTSGPWPPVSLLFLSSGNKTFLVNQCFISIFLTVFS